MQRRRIKRDYRGFRSPARFLAFCKKVAHALTDNPNCPASIDPIRLQYGEKVAALDKSYHVALDGGHSFIRERESLSQEVMVLLDQLAALLESAFILNPDALLTTGFTITQERRATPRVKVPLTSPQDFKVTNAPAPGQVLASGSTLPGALIREIHMNQKDPSVEDDWRHKANFSDSMEMMMENVPSGNTFFRMRLFGQDGPGPWSAVVSIFVT